MDEELCRAGLIDQVRRTCIVRSRPDRPLADSRGRPQDWLFDLRPLILDGEASAKLAALFWARMEGCWPFQVAAQELAAVPLLGAILAYGVQIGRVTSGVVVRRERKSYGRQRQLEGELSDRPVVLIDDIVNSGGSIERAIAALQEEDATVAGVFVLVDFESKALAEKRGELGAPLETLFRLSEFDIAFPERPAPRLDKPLEIAWRFRPRRPSYLFVARKAAPVLAGALVLHTSEDGWLQALERESGEAVWAVQIARRPGKGSWSTPLVIDGAVYTASYEGAVFRLDLATGDIVWRFEGADWVGSSPATGPSRNSIFIGLEHALRGGTGGVARLDIERGEMIWEHRIPAQVHATPTFLPGEGVVCGANDGLLRLLNPNDGRLIWKVDLGGDIKSSAAIASDGAHIVISSCDGAVYAVKRKTGDISWRTQTGGPVFGSPLVIDAEVFVGSTDGAVYRLGSETGEVRARTHLGGKIFASPVQSDAHVVVGSTTGQVSRLTQDRLALVAQHQFPERVTSEIAVDGQRMFVPTFDGQLFCTAGWGLA